MLNPPPLFFQAMLSFYGKGPVEPRTSGVGLQKNTAGEEYGSPSFPVVDKNDYL